MATPVKKSATRNTVNKARRRNNRQSRRGIILLAFSCALLLIGWLIPDHCRRSGDTIDPSTDLEAVVTNPDLSEQIVKYSGMTISFNPEMHVPNWVAYELTAEEADGREPRAGGFMVDPDVDGCATPADYKNTGFDRGHMAPAADMKWSPEAMHESFYMTNIVPQARSLNSGTWGRLENKCRQRARKDSAIVIISGPVLTDKIEMHIGATGVAVPQRLFKVVMSPYSDPPQAIGFLIPNGTLKGGMEAYAVSVDSVETVTGHDFFSALPDDIENRIESQVNFNRWSRMQ